MAFYGGYGFEGRHLLGGSGPGQGQQNVAVRCLKRRNPTMEVVRLGIKMLIFSLRPYSINSSASSSLFISRRLILSVRLGEWCRMFVGTPLSSTCLCHEELDQMRIYAYLQS